MPTGNARNLSHRIRGDYLRSCTLLLLAEGRKHGYELLVELSERGYGDTDAGGLYRTLRTMEDEGLVRSSWQHGDSGPARRVYYITEEGLAALRDCALAVRNMRRRLNRFLHDYRDISEATPLQTSS